MTPSRATPERPARTRAEWWTFAVALCLVGLVVGVILAGWITGPSGPPVLVAGRSGPVIHEGSVYRVPFEVRNDGGDAATSVQVVAELTIDGERAGGGEQSVMFLSGGERERGQFLFREDPALGELTIEVTSYALP